MSGVIWKTPSGATGREIGRQCIGGVLVIAVQTGEPDETGHTGKSEHWPAGDLVEVVE